MVLQDQVRRHLLEHEKIPHDEMMFSVFEPHTRWIKKGKAKEVELGVPPSVMESAMHALECHGLSRIRNRGAERFERTVALSILAANCHRLGRMLQGAERARRVRRKRYKQAA